MADDVKGGAVGEAGPRGGFGASLVAVAAMVVATASPYLVGVLAPFLTEAFRLSSTAYGFLAAGSYTVAAVASRSVGALVDRAEVRFGLIALMGASCLSWLGLALAQGFWSAMAAVAVGGVGLAASNPLTNRMVMEARPRNFGLALGIKQAGVPLSAFLIGAVAPVLATAWGWRIALCALAPVPVLLTVWGCHYFPRRRATRAGTRTKGGRTPKEIRRLAVYAGLMGAGGGILNAYIALFAVTRLDIDRASAGLLVALLGGIGVGSRVAWAALSQRVHPMNLLLGLAVGATCSSALLLAVQSLGTAALVATCVLAGTTSVSWLGVAMVAVFRLKPQSIGVSTGSVSKGFYLGLLVAPITGGVLLEYTHSYEGLWAVQAACFALACALALRGRAAVRAGSRDATSSEPAPKSADRPTGT
jgi:predicted MFS family arabinose efflux permease